MTKKELVKAVANKHNEFTQKEISVIVDTVLETITETVGKGEKVALAGFGSFETAIRSSRQGRNPATGEIMTIPAKKVCKFKAMKGLKDAVQ